MLGNQNNISGGKQKSSSHNNIFEESFSSYLTAGNPMVNEGLNDTVLLSLLEKSGQKKNIPNCNEQNTGFLYESFSEFMNPSGTVPTGAPQKQMEAQNLSLSNLPVQNNQGNTQVYNTVSPAMLTVGEMSVSEECFESTQNNPTEIIKDLNIDPTKRKRARPGISLDKVIESGVDPKSLHPVVLRRLKNTEAARRSRMKRQTKIENMEQIISKQGDQIDFLRNEISRLKKEVSDYGLLMSVCENERRNYKRLQQWLASNRIFVPKDFYH